MDAFFLLSTSLGEYIRVFLIHCDQKQKQKLSCFANRFFYWKKGQREQSRQVSKRARKRVITRKLQSLSLSFILRTPVHFNKFFNALCVVLFLQSIFPIVFFIEYGALVACLYIALKITIMNTVHIFVDLPFLGTSLFHVFKQH